MNYHALTHFLQVLQYSLSFRTILTKYTGILCMFGIPDFLSVDAGVSVQKWRHFPALENISFFWEKNQRRTLLCKIAAVVGHWSQVNSLLWKSFAAILLWKQIPLLIFFSWKHEKKCKKESEVGNSWRWSADGQGSISMKKEVSWQVERKEEIGIAFNPNFHLPLMIRIKPLNQYKYIFWKVETKSTFELAAR